MVILVCHPIQSLFLLAPRVSGDKLWIYDLDQEKSSSCRGMNETAGEDLLQNMQWFMERNLESLNHGHLFHILIGSATIFFECLVRSTEIP